MIKGFSYIKAFALFALLSGPAQVMAANDFSGNITVGAEFLNLDGESFTHGEYDGRDDDGLYFLGNADVNYEKEANYLQLRTHDMGLDSRYIHIEGGKVGSYKLFLEYDQSPHLLSNVSRTPFDGAGSDTLTLPAGFGQYSSTSQMPLSSNLKDVDLKLKRRSVTVGHSSRISKKVDIDISFKREKKEGISSIGGGVGQFEFWPKSVILPEPVNYTTDELNSTVTYHDKRYDAALAYYLSSFTNDDSSLTWDNPYIEDGGSAFPSTGRLSLPPSNKHHKISASLAARLAKTTGVSIVAGWGSMKQDEALLPYSVNGEVPPRNSAGAKIETTNVNVNLSSRPTPKIALTGKYRYYKTTNKTKQDHFRLVMNDTGGQAPADSKFDLYNLPYDYTQKKASLDAVLKFTKGSSLKLGYENDIMERSYRAIARTKEDSFKLKLNSRLATFISASLKYDYSRRKSDGKNDQSLAYESNHTATYISNTNASLRIYNLNDLRQYDIANRDRAVFSANAVITLWEKSLLSLNYNRGDDDYKDSYINSMYGLKSRENRNYTFDLSTAISKDLSFYTYYTNEKMNSSQASSSSLSGLWMANHKDHNDTLGVGGSFAFNRDLTFDAFYTYSKSKGSINFSGAAAQDMPDVTTKLDSFEIKGRYKLNKKMTVGLGYFYEEYDSDDWATDGLSPNDLSNMDSYVLTLSGSVPDYKAHIAQFFISYNL